MRLIDIDNIALTPIDITDLPEDKCLLVYLKEDIDNAPTVELTEEQAIDKLHETGWLQEHDKQMTEKPQGEWIDYDNTFYKCPDCGYLLEKCCPQCQNKVILPKGGAE